MYKMKPKQLKSVNKRDWVCEKCNDDTHIDSNCDIETDVNDLNEASEFNVTDVDFKNMMIWYSIPSDLITIQQIKYILMLQEIKMFIIVVI